MLALASRPLSSPLVSAQISPPKYVQEYGVPTANSAPLAITVDSVGKVWFTESNASKLATFDPVNQTFREYNVPWAGDMWGIVTDHQGYVWFTQYTGKGSVNPGGTIVTGGTGRIVRFDITTANFTSITIPTNGSFPMRLTLDKQGRIWFTEFLGNKIGVFDPATNRLQEYRIPTNVSGATDLTFDKQGVLWFSESYARKLGRFSPQNQSFTEYPLGAETASQIVSSPVGIAVDTNGDVWVADHGGNWIIRFNPITQEIVKYPTHFPPEDIYPISLVNDVLIDSNGRVWFAEHGGNSVGYYEPETRTMVEFPIPTGPISTTLWLALAPNGDVWFAEWSGNNIGVVRSGFLVPLSVITSVSSVTVNDGQQMTFPMQIKIVQAMSENGTLRYAWGSYNPFDVSGLFSPQYPLLISSTVISAQAQLRISETAEAGNYTLALGIETQSVNVWRMISVEVVKSHASNQLPLLDLEALGVAVILALSFYLLRKSRRPDRIYET
jgi:virginiamycin B lyase